jgi:hypothetical protein
MNSSRIIPFRWALPTAQLAVCAVLLWLWSGFLLMQMRVVAHDHWPTKFAQPVYRLHATLELETPRQERAAELAQLRVSMPALLNLPGGFLGLATPASVPKGMLPEFWRSISWPFVGIIFWWIGGRGLDALVGARRRVLLPAITWIEVALGSLVVVFCGAICMGFLEDASMRDEFFYPWRWAAAACVLWIVLGAVTPAARVVQWRIRRKATARPGAARRHSSPHAPSG